MSEFNMTIPSGTTRVFHTAGKYCDKDISITATGGDYDKGVTDGIEQGKQAGYDAFWDTYQENGNRTLYDCAFGGSGWTNETFKPKYNITPTQATYMFRKFAFSGDLVETCENLGITLDFSQCTRMQEVFSNTPNITRVGVIDITSASTNVVNAFAYSAVKTIDKLIIDETNTNLDHFPGVTYGLENITIEGTIAVNISFYGSSLLTLASVDSIINALKDLTGATAQTLTFHADVGAKLTDEQKAAITAKNWTLVY